MFEEVILPVLQANWGILFVVVVVVLYLLAGWGSKGI